MSESSQQPKTKFKEGDWVYYQGNLQKVEKIFKNDRGWNYMLKWSGGKGSSAHLVKTIEPYLKKA